jgi:type IV pilus assembly protein PilX
VNVSTSNSPHKRALVVHSSLVKQQGVVLIVALLVLVALTIASLGLLRSVDTTTAATGNLGFKKDIYRQSNRGIQSAVDSLNSIRATSLELPLVNNATVGYYASANLPVDARGIPTILLNAPVPDTPGVATAIPGIGQFVVPIGTAGGGGYVFRYTAERLCTTAGAPEPAINPCRQATGVGTATPAGSFQPLITQGGSVYTRLTLRVDGPKNSTSYFQVMLL